MISPQQPIGLSTKGFLVLGVALLVITTGFVAIRLINSIVKSHNLVIDDYASVTALILLTANFALSDLSAKGIVSPKSTVQYLLNLATALGFLAGAKYWASKAPILLLYIRIFGVRERLRYISYIVLLFTGLLFLAGTTVGIARCTTPQPQPLTPEFLSNCKKTGSQLSVFLGTINIVADLIILVLPLRAIYGLQLPPRKKIGLSIVFLTGIFAIIASAVSLYFKALSIKGTSTSLTNALICFVIECSITIIVGCVPATYAFWTYTIVQSRLFKRLQSLFSRVHSTPSGDPRQSRVSEAKLGIRNRGLSDTNASEYRVVREITVKNSTHSNRGPSTSTPLYTAEAYH